MSLSQDASLEAVDWSDADDDVTFSGDGGSGSGQSLAVVDCAVSDCSHRAPSVDHQRSVGSSRLHHSLHAALKPNSITLAGSELVRRWFELDGVMEFGFEPVCDQLRTSSEPAIVMEFGFYYARPCTFVDISYVLRWWYRGAFVAVL